MVELLPPEEDYKTKKNIDYMDMSNCLIDLKNISNDLKKSDIHNHYILEDRIEEIEYYFNQLKWLKYEKQENDN